MISIEIFTSARGRPFNGWWRGFIIFSERAFHCKNYMNNITRFTASRYVERTYCHCEPSRNKEAPFSHSSHQTDEKTCSQALPRPFRYFLFPLTYQSILHSIHTGMDSKVLCAVHTVWSELKNAASSNTGVPLFRGAFIGWLSRLPSLCHHRTSAILPVMVHLVGVGVVKHR